MCPAVSAPFTMCSKLLKRVAHSPRILCSRLGATQFALPAAVDLLRQLRTAPPGRSLSLYSWPRPIRLILMVQCCAGRASRRRRRLRNPRRACSLEQPMPKLFCATGSSFAWLRRAIQRARLSAFRRAGAITNRVGACAFSLLARPGAHARRQPSGRAYHHHQRQPIAAHPMARFLMDAGFHPGPLACTCAAFCYRLGKTSTNPTPARSIIRA